MNSAKEAFDKMMFSGIENLENHMIVGNYYGKEPKKVAECSDCGEDIFDMEWGGRGTLGDTEICLCKVCYERWSWQFESENYFEDDEDE